MKKIVFMGTPPIAARVLQELLDMQADVSLVVSQPDKKVGRKQKIVYPAVKELALKHDIEVFQPSKIKTDYERIMEVKPDLIVTCAYGQIIPKELLDLPTYGCINLHGSLLPEYRGGAPIQRAIWDGLKESGMSLMEMSEKMDAGGVMDQDVFEITPKDDSTSVFEKMGESAARLLRKNLQTILDGEAEFKPQDPEKVTFAPIIKKEEEALNFNQEDERIFNQIRALAKTPGAYVKVKNKKLKILKANYSTAPVEFKKLESKKKNSLALGLHNGSLELAEVQMEGKPVMNIKDFMNGQGRSLVGEFVE